MLKTGKFAVLAILGALAINPAFAEDKSAALVNGVSIPQARIDLRVKAAAAQGQADSPELRKAIRDDMINLEVMAQEAVKTGLDKNADVVQQVELAKQSVLVGAFVQDYVKNHPISEDQLKQEYDKLKTKLGNKEYNTRHILVGTEAEAKDIIAQLGKK
ncbi:MAG: peptidylprolyl isomerase, partial [Gallionella sp.]|nr:peptidylprolyl isomerase [Gallionella sp.]